MYVGLFKFKGVSINSDCKILLATNFEFFRNIFDFNFILSITCWLSKRNVIGLGSVSVFNFDIILLQWVKLDTISSNWPAHSNQDISSLLSALTGSVNTCDWTDKS